MFQKKFRLPASVRLAKAHTSFSSYFTLKGIPNNLEQNRYGFIVSKKIDKRAVGRNRLKRRFRAQVEQIHPELQQGYDFLFILKKEAVEQTTDNLRQELINLFLKNSLLKEIQK
jgi:ribonuclease P protein component